MKCAVCNANLRAKAIFCDICGQKLDRGSASETVDLSSAPQIRTPQPKGPLFLGGAALLLLGVWVGATFLSAEPAPAPREPASPKQTAVVIQSATLPEAPRVAPRSDAPTSIVVEPPATTPALTDPFKEPKQPQNGELVNPFKKRATPSKETAPDSALNPFKTKSSGLKTNPDSTLKPTFGQGRE